MTRWLSVTLSPDVPVVSTTGASSLKSPASIWRGVAFFTMFTTSAMADVTFNAELQATGEEQTMLKPVFTEFSDNFPYLRRGGNWSKKCSNATRTVCLPSLCEIDYNRGDGSGFGKVISSAFGIEGSRYNLNKETKCLTSYAKICNDRHFGGGGKYDGHHVIYGKCPTTQSWSSTQLKENLSFRASDGFKWLANYEGQIGTSDGIPTTVTNLQYSAKIIPGSKQPPNAAISVGMFNGHPNATAKNGSQFWAIDSSANSDKLVLHATGPSLICQGTEFEVTVKAENTVAVDGAEIYIKFDPSQLQVSSITTSSNFDTELLSDYDNGNGSIEFMAFDSKLITDSIFDIFTVKFSSIGTDTSTNVEFVNGSQFTAGLDALPSVALGNQQINFAYCLNYQVDLQRAKPKGNASWITDLTVSVGTLTDAIEYASTTNESGEGILMLNKQLGATEYFCVKDAQSLASKVIPPFTKIGDKISLSENNGQNSPLLEGDVAIKDSNNVPVAGFDGVINLVDILYLKENEIDLDKSGDFTGDMELLKDNLNKIPLNGKKKRESACIETATINGSMLRRGTRDSRGNGNEGLEQLLADALPTNLVEGESFDVTLTISATDANPVDGIQTNLEYDSDSLQINTVTPTESLDVLLSDFDNSQGVLNLIAVAWKTPPLTSTFDLVTINFTLLKESGEKTLHFSKDERQESMVYAGGELVDDLEEIILPQAETTSSNNLPTAVFAITPETGEAPLTIALDGSASSDTDGTIASHVWTASNGQTANGQTAELTFSEAGDYTITLEVTDNEGATAQVQKAISVSVQEAPNEPPTAALAITPETGEAPLTIALDGSASSDTDGTIASHVWTASDGQTANGQNAELTFSEAGDYTITLEVTDNDGATNSATKNVKVEAAANYVASGTIRDKEGNPIAGVNVQVGDKTAVTNDKGEWEITGLQEGDDYTATASKDGYTFAPIEFALGNDEFTQTVVMKPLSALNVKVIAEPSAPKQGENITFIATVTNGGSETATGVALTNVLSNGISLVSIEALDGGECDTSTVTCTLPDLTTGATAKVKLAVNNSAANKVANEATVTSNEYPADVHKKNVNITPYLSVSVNCAPKTVEPKGGLHCTAEVVLSSLAPSAATGINLVMTLPNGVELQSLNTDYGMCDTSEQPILTCSLTDLSVDSPDDISRVAVSFDSVLQDPGLLALTHDAKVTANEYPAHTTRARTKVFIPPEYQVDLAIVIDVTGSMQQEMNSTKNAVNKFIADLEPSQVPLTALVVFRDEVTVKAVTTDLSLVETAINKMKASGGGTCPEASVEALDVAITHVKEGGTIFFVTDASPYEDADVAGIVERMKTKGIIFNAIVTGDCSNKESWNVLP
ncbi:MAG: hypothetical protein DRQ57_18475 [Gammaproteobacteria bacterium]|nr:MAG: hypothetical protein DRQ57_18475 [Gammaproteobacteria bacterium]